MQPAPEATPDGVTVQYRYNTFFQSPENKRASAGKPRAHSLFPSPDSNVIPWCAEPVKEGQSGSSRSREPVEIQWQTGIS